LAPGKTREIASSLPVKAVRRLSITLRRPFSRIWLRRPSADRPTSVRAFCASVEGFRRVVNIDLRAVPDSVALRPWSDMAAIAAPTSLNFTPSSEATGPMLCIGCIISSREARPSRPAAMKTDAACAALRFSFL